MTLSMADGLIPSGVDGDRAKKRRKKPMNTIKIMGFFMKLSWRFEIIRINLTDV